jgi:hypothetical protein
MFGPTSWFQFRWLNIMYLLSWLAITYWLFGGYYDDLQFFPALNATDVETKPPESSETPTPTPSTTEPTESTAPHPSSSPSPSSLTSPSATPSPTPAVQFPSATSALFANPFDVYPATDPIYPNERVSSTHPRLRHILHRWVHLADRMEWRYVAIAGTLLAALRNGRFIPWDTDMDVAIDRTTAERIRDLAATEGLHNRTSIDGISIEWNTAVIDNQPWLDEEVRLIVNKHRAMDLPGDSLRYNRTGDLVPSQEDSVSFAGPFARMISYVGGRTAHLDVFCIEGFAGRYGDDATEVGPQLASFPKKVEPCPLEGQMVWCPSKEDYEPMLRHDYGDDYIVPQH